jgi:hypothetical protein
VYRHIDIGVEKCVRYLGGTEASVVNPEALDAVAGLCTDRSTDVDYYQDARESYVVNPNHAEDGAVWG